MPTTNLGLPLITGNMTADVVRDMNALAEAVDAKVAGKETLATHMAEDVSNIISASRSLNVTGVQSITLYGKVQTVRVEALVNGTKITSKGYYIKRSTLEAQYSIASVSDGSFLLSASDGIVIRTATSTVSGNLAIVGNKLNITWTILSGSPTELVNLFITTWSHGG